MKELERTFSVCPICFNEGKIQKIHASIIEDKDKIWITKNCQRHGSFKEVYFGDIELYKKWMKYKVTSKPVNYIKTKIFTDIELYKKHTSKAMLTNLVITNRTNLKCDQIFFNAYVDGFVYEPSLTQLNKLLRQSQNLASNNLCSMQITGGEPTVREDLFDIIHMAQKNGFRIFKFKQMV